ncbi:MAG: hypothetical protein RBS19_01855 [Bacteroidales bacterium]|nr:hypothetical protein [Bacteroidales bacterium]MDY0215676.1 hypothetical protein [Bacteroidales bacterium]
MKNYRLLIIIFATLGIASCSPKFYTPNSHNVPLLSEKGEASLTLTGNGNQLEFQGAYAITNHIAIKADGGIFSPSDINNGNGGSGKFGELGVGYFTPIHENWIFETYGIVGYGGFENHMPSTQENYPSTKGNISAKLLRVGIQPNFGFKSKYFSAAVSSRIVNLSYNNIKGDLIYRDISQTQYLKNNSSHFLVEPALTLRGGTESFKLQLQYGYSFNLTNKSFKQDVMFLTAGINVNF